MKPLFIILFIFCCAHMQAQDYRALIKPLEDSISQMGALLHHVRIGYEKRYKLDSLQQSYAMLRQRLLATKINYIKSHANQPEALKLFEKEVVYGTAALMFSPDSLMLIYAGFDRSIKESEQGKIIYKEIAKRQRLLVNNVVPDFDFKSNMGEQYRLSSFRGQYVLLGFWFNGCKGCAESFPIIKKLHEAYKGKLQVLSISTDQQFEGWINGLKRYQLPWMQTWDGKGYIDGPSVESLYDVRYAPQYYLIDKDGKLIYHSGQMKDDDSYSVLKGMLKELMK